jgi:glycosyltransferase involved in cell wall biosynthesis
MGNAWLDEREIGHMGPMRLVVVSTYPPRQCGLAAYAKDLRQALMDAAPEWHVDVCAMDRDGLPYGPEVCAEIRQDELADYGRTADALADAGVDFVLIQHEFGIFGGADGEYVRTFAAGLRRRGVPYAVTLHTVLAEPSPRQAAVLRDLCRGAALTTVFTDSGRRLVVDAGLASPDRLAVLPHGGPVILRQPVDTRALRPVVTRMLDEVADGPLLSTFGLIRPDKGLELAIAALPEIVARHPGTRYLIAGASHAEVVRHSGEEYRDGLVALARRLGVERHVRFLNTFLTDAELAAVLVATDVYVTPYRTVEQISSGALTFAVVAGCPVVSTAYRYAEDLLAPRDGWAAGVVVPCDDSAALADAVAGLLDDRAALDRARKAADSLGATLTWPAVAARTVEALRPVLPDGPALRLDHLARLTDEGGIVQFASGDEPDRGSGYCVDDVARLAIVAAGLFGQGAAAVRAGAWLDMSVRFLAEAVGPGGIRNMRAADGTWLDEPHLGDHFGRALWALGVLAGIREDAADPLCELLAAVPGLTFPRSAAYAALGLARVPTPEARAALRIVAGRLDAAVRTGTPDWCWFEPELTYDNARLPQGLIAAGRALGEPAMVRRGLATLDWYAGQVGLSGRHPMLRNVGNHWRRAGTRVSDEGDEQPLDAAATVEALVEAFRCTGEERYAELARRAHAWFHGANRAGASLYDRASGGCHDGLYADGANPNMGAESTLAYYQSLLALADAGLVRLRR